MVSCIQQVYFWMKHQGSIVKVSDNQIVKLSHQSAFFTPGRPVSSYIFGISVSDTFYAKSSKRYMRRAKRIHLLGRETSRPMGLLCPLHSSKCITDLGYIEKKLPQL